MAAAYLTGCRPEAADRARKETVAAQNVDNEKQARDSLPVDDDARPEELVPYALTWATLADVEFSWEYSTELGQEVPFPVFSDTVKQLEGRLVTLTGFVIPLEETGDETIIVLSAFPYTECFFCGGAGPESVVDILPKEPLGRHRLDEKATFRGRLRLNDDDFMYLNYILEEAEWIRH